MTAIPTTIHTVCGACRRTVDPTHAHVCVIPVPGSIVARARMERRAGAAQDAIERAA